MFIYTYILYIHICTLKAQSLFDGSKLVVSSYSCLGLNALARLERSGGAGARGAKPGKDLPLRK